MSLFGLRRSDKSKKHQPPTQDDERVGRSQSRGRSLSPWRRSSKSRSRNRSTTIQQQPRSRDPSAEGVRGDDTEGDSEGENARPMPLVQVANAFEDDSDDDSDAASVGTAGSRDDFTDDDDELFDANGDFFDEEVEKNTEANASADTPFDFLTREGTTMVYPGEGPNLLPPTDPMSATFRAGALAQRVPPAAAPSPSLTAPASSSTAATPPRSNPRTGAPPRRRLTRSGTVSSAPKLELHTGRPAFEKNRCTVTITHGEPDRVLDESGGRKQRRRYLVASDLSEESMYAIQWAIGTVIREGDECIIVSVMETDTKLDSDDPAAKHNKMANQRERQAAALQLARGATALLERTRLNVRVVCQAIHAKVPRHMLVDMIDYLEPTLVLVGSRGLTRLKGMLLGSTSNYLIQKSSAPVMVTRRPLRVSRTVHRKLASLDRTARTSLADATIDKESHAQAVEDPGEKATEGEDVKERVGEMRVGHGEGEGEGEGKAGGVGQGLGRVVSTEGSA